MTAQMATQSVPAAPHWADVNAPGNLSMLDERELRRAVMKIWLELESIYNVTWAQVHRDIAAYILPDRGQFDQLQAGNRGQRNDGQILNGCATDACGKLTAAIGIGVTSEAREWVGFTTENPLDAEDEGNREYCHEVQSIFFNIIAKSNFYPQNRNLLADIVGFGTGLMFVWPDKETIVRFEHAPIGTYRLGVDAKCRVNVVARRYVMTASQMSQEFGYEKISPGAQRALLNGMPQVSYQVLNVIMPRDIRKSIDEKSKEPRQPTTATREPGHLGAINKPWASYWLEVGAGWWGAATVMGTGEINDGTGPQGILRQSGFDQPPFVAPRWNAIGFDAYGKENPGRNALGDVKQLQAFEHAAAKMVAKIVDPPMNAPDKMVNASLKPGALNRIPGDNAGAKFEPSVTVQPGSVQTADNQIAKLEKRIDRWCFADILFLLSRDASRQPKTAEEIRGREGEQILQLGDVFSRYSNEALKPLVGYVFEEMQRARILPPPPPSLLKVGKIKLEFQNPLVSAQKTVGYTAIQQLISLGVSLGEAKRAGADKLDSDEILDSAAEMLGVKPNMLKTDAAVAQERQAASQAAQAQKQGAAMTEAAPAIKSLSDTNPQNLDALLSRFGPNAQAQGTA